MSVERGLEVRVGEEVVRAADGVLLGARVSRADDRPGVAALEFAPAPLWAELGLGVSVSVDDPAAPGVDTAPFTGMVVGWELESWAGRRVLRVHAEDALGRLQGPPALRVWEQASDADVVGDVLRAAGVPFDAPRDWSPQPGEVHQIECSDLTFVVGRAARQGAVVRVRAGRVRFERAASGARRVLDGVIAARVKVDPREVAAELLAEGWDPVRGEPAEVLVDAASVRGVEGAPLERDRSSAGSPHPWRLPAGATSPQDLGRLAREALAQRARTLVTAELEVHGLRPADLGDVVRVPDLAGGLEVVGVVTAIEQVWSVGRTPLVRLTVRGDTAPRWVRAGRAA